MTAHPHLSLKQAVTPEEVAAARLLFVDKTTQALAADAAPDSIEAIFGLAGDGLPAPDGLPSWETLPARSARSAASAG